MMASVKILILLGLVALGFLIPSQVAATARDIGTESSLGREEALTNPVIVLVSDHGDHKLEQSNIRDHKSISFNVDIDDYLEFIERLRKEVRVTEAHGIPVLAPQRPETPENAQWLDIRLVAGTSEITLRLEQSNLYVRGYSRSTDDFFWELTDTHLIPDSRDLLFSGSYREANGIVNAAGGTVTRGTLLLGRIQLENAIYTLARLDTPLGHNSEAAARSLLILIQMIAEAARYRTISNYLGTGYWTSAGVTLDDRMLAMQNGWGQLSTALLQVDRNPTDSTPLPNIQSINPTEVYTYRQALLALGLLVITRPSGGSSRSTPDYGRCLMNLEYVRINNIDGEKTGNLFGYVRVNDAWYEHVFYQRIASQYEDVSPGGFATLNDSSHTFPVSGMDALTIGVSLFDYDSLSPNDKIAQGEIVWDRLVESVTFANYDKHLQRVVTGEYGDVTVGYSVLSNALGVTIQVLLIDGDGESTAEVYGTLTASQVLGGSTGLAPITLLNKSSKHYVEVRKGQPIPIARSVVAASASTKFTITADLWDYDTLSPDDAIAQGTADFTVQPGTQRQYINGRYGQVQVVITCA